MIWAPFVLGDLGFGMLRDLDHGLVEALRAVVPEGCLRAVEPKYLEEPRGRWQGRGGVVALPRSVDEVSRILRFCHEARVAVVPWGGGTGLVGGQLKADGSVPLILSLERMSAVRDVWAQENVIVVEAGAKLAEVRAAAEGVGRMFPLSLASEGSCSIGGNLATNAGGVNVLRYGNTRDLCLGVEAVLADGTVIHGLKRLRKDNTGYDLRHLLIGSEGSLGVITAASLRLVAPAPEQGVAVMAVSGPEAALGLLGEAQALTSGCVTAFELIARQSLEFLAETMPDVRLPFADGFPEWFVLIEVGLPAGMAANVALEAIFTCGFDRGWVDEGMVAQSAAQAQEFWRVRESIPLANRKIGAISSHDISLPLSEIAGFVVQAKAALQARAEMRINCFGHLGDGNLHFNLFPTVGKVRGDYDLLRDSLKQQVHDLVHARGGSVSAEHGIGRLKVDDLTRYGDPGRIAAMRAIKGALDPHGILNPGAVLA